MFSLLRMNVRNRASFKLALGFIAGVSVVGCVGDNGSSKSSIVATITSPSTQESCLNLGFGSECNIKLQITNNSGTDLTMGYTANASGAYQELPTGYAVSPLDNCDEEMNLHMGSTWTCNQSVNYSMGSLGVPTALYFVLCNNSCDEPGSIVAITPTPINLKAIE